MSISSQIEKYPAQELKDQILNPVWHVHNGNPPNEKNCDAIFNAT